jgi:hypothetical protein
MPAYRGSEAGEELLLASVIGVSRTGPRGWQARIAGDRLFWLPYALCLGKVARDNLAKAVEIPAAQL